MPSKKDSDQSECFARRILLFHLLTYENTQILIPGTLSINASTNEATLQVF